MNKLKALKNRLFWLNEDLIKAIASKGAKSADAKQIKREIQQVKDEIARVKGEVEVGE